MTCRCGVRLHRISGPIALQSTGSSITWADINGTSHAAHLEGPDGNAR